jgi:AcrR family transcriptional regulator
MAVDDRLAALVARVAEFHITDRAMKRAQSDMESALHTGDVDERSREAYLHAVRQYFDGFEREARSALRDVDRRLENVNQIRFNLTAERGVAVKRIEATQTVLNDVAQLEEGGPG